MKRAAVLGRFDHINIVVADLKAAKEFFLQLGFEQGDASELKGEWISSIVGLPDVWAFYQSMRLPGSSVSVELIQYHNPLSGGNPNVNKANQLGYRHIAFAVEDIEQTVTQLRQKGIQFVSDIQVYEKRGKKLVYFYGPEGILLELAEYPKWK